ncbi:MAG: hypothetical protein KAU36_01900 [candidate division Zixibacteria bacterium]|nr:hypothetical protein [candidate division Zixibacteria bacterium]
MSRQNFETATLIKLQQVSWYLALAWFGLIAVMIFAGVEGAVLFAKYGVVYVLVVTVAKLFIMAHEFRKVKMTRFFILCCVLVVVLLSTILLRYWV